MAALYTPFSLIRTKTSLLYQRGGGGGPEVRGQFLHKSCLFLGLFLFSMSEIRAQSQGMGVSGEPVNMSLLDISPRRFY